MKAMVLAAGAGTRLRPLTDTCPKPMLPIAGRPLLERTLRWLRGYGVAEAALNLHHLPSVVTGALGDGAALGMRLRYSFEPELRGTAGALHGFDGFFDQPFLVIYGDMLLDIDLDELTSFHQSRGALMTLALKRTATPWSQGMVERAADGRVLRFVEKPAAWDGGDTANAGVYICQPELLTHVPRATCDFGHDIIPALLRAGSPVYGRLASGYLLDIGTPDAYQQAQQDWRGRDERDARAIAVGGPPS